MDARWTAEREGYDESVFTITFITDQGWAAWLVQEAAKAATEQVKNRLEEDKISQLMKRIHRQDKEV